MDHSELCFLAKGGRPVKQASQPVPLHRETQPQTLVTRTSFVLGGGGLT